MHDDKTLQWYDRMGKARPSSEAHGTVEDIRKNLKRLKTENWRVEGNMLKADTDMGPLTQRIPPDYICKGTDSEGLPILVKLSL